MHWRLDTTLADEMAAFLAFDGTSHLTLLDAVGRRCAAGNEHKADAVGRGVTPPGPDVAATCEALLSGDRRSWTCLATAPLYAALVNTLGLGHATVAVWDTGPESLRGTHTSVLVRHDAGQGTRWSVCEPTFAVAATLDLPVTEAGAAARQLVVDTGATPWWAEVRGAAFASPSRYRLADRDCTPSRLAELAAASADSGVRCDTRNRRLAGRTWLTQVVESRSGAVRLLEWSSDVASPWAATCSQRVLDGWPR